MDGEERKGGSGAALGVGTPIPGLPWRCTSGLASPHAAWFPVGQDSPCSSSATRLCRELSSFSMSCCCWLRSLLAACRSFCRVRILERSCSSSCSILVCSASRASAGAVGTEPLARAGSSCCAPRERERRQQQGVSTKRLNARPRGLLQELRPHHPHHYNKVLAASVLAAVGAEQGRVLAPSRCLLCCFSTAGAVASCPRAAILLARLSPCVGACTRARSGR